MGGSIPGGGCFDWVGEFFFESDDLVLATDNIAVPQQQQQQQRDVGGEMTQV